MELIDKAVVVAEIKRISCENPMDNSWYVDTEELLNFINTLEVKLEVEEEPVSEDLGDYISELSKQFPEVSFAKLSRIAVRVSRWQQNQDVKNKLPKVTDRTDLDEYAYQCAYDMSNDWAIDNPTWHDVEDACKLGAKWQEQQDKSTIELAEDHAYFAGRTNTMDEINEALLSEVLPCFMHGGEADEVVAKLDEVLNQKK